MPNLFDKFCMSATINEAERNKLSELFRLEMSLVSNGIKFKPIYKTTKRTYFDKRLENLDQRLKDIKQYIHTLQKEEQKANAIALQIKMQNEETQRIIEANKILKQNIIEEQTRLICCESNKRKRISFLQKEELNDISQEIQLNIISIQKTFENQSRNNFIMALLSAPKPVRIQPVLPVLQPDNIITISEEQPKRTFPLGRFVYKQPRTYNINNLISECKKNYANISLLQEQEFKNIKSLFVKEFQKTVEKDRQNIKVKILCNTCTLRKQPIQP